MSNVGPQNRPIPIIEAKYEYTSDFPAILEQLRACLLLTTYQAGQLIVIATRDGQLTFSFSQFEQAMGVAVSPSKIAVASKRDIWFLKSSAGLADKIEPSGQFDRCYLARGSHHTGPILCHEIAWAIDELWLVNTLFSCLSTLSSEHHFIPRWRPAFIDALAAEDRCHLNGVALQDGRPRFVTALAESNVPAGWRPNKAKSGVIMDVQSNNIIAHGLCMPHSPRWYHDRLWALNSGRGQLVQVDIASGHIVVIATVGGYARGLAFLGPYAFVGESTIRESAVFGDLPINEKRDRLRCGIAVIDIRSGQQVATLTFHSGVQEVFDVQVLANCHQPHIGGPLADFDGQQFVWVLPQ